jgi:hypothetical protein
MYFEIAEVSTEKQSGHTYVVVNFWASQVEADAGEPPLLTNDFLMQLRKDVERVVTDPAGRLKRTDGSFVAPEDATDKDEFEREAFEKADEDVQDEIVRNVLAYWERAQAAGYAGDHTGDASKPLFVRGREVRQRASQTFERDESDVRGVLAKTAALRGQRRDESDIRNARAKQGGLSRDRGALR